MCNVEGLGAEQGLPYWPDTLKQMWLNCLPSHISILYWSGLGLSSTPQKCQLQSVHLHTPQSRLVGGLLHNGLECLVPNDNTHDVLLNTVVEDMATMFKAADDQRRMGLEGQHACPP